jgi:EmrB/QacA subfamily drug resistance transporter
MSQKWWVLTAVAFGTFMATLDSSIVNIALPSLTKALDTDLYQIKWVVIVYLLTITCLLLPFGRLADQYGRKVIFQIGYIVFTFGSVLCGLSSSLGWLIAARTLQAVGASMLMSNGPALITSIFPAGERGKALGTLAMVVSTGLICGPSIGGLLITQFGWRSIFLVNAPIGLLGAFLVGRFVPIDQRRGKEPFDWPGAILQTVLLLSFILLVDPPIISVSGSSPFPISRLIVALVMCAFAALFLKLQSETKSPIIDITLFKNRTFWTGNLASFLIFVSYSSFIVMMPFFLEEVLHYNPGRAGLFMTAIPLTVFVVAPISGRISDRAGSQELSFVGALIGAIGMFIMAGLFGKGIDEATAPSAIIAQLCLIGLATGLFQSPNNNAVMSSVPTNKLGIASALIATIRNLGFVTGTGLATGLFAWRHLVTGNYVSSLHFTFFVSGFVALGAMFAALGKPRGPLYDTNKSPSSE